MVSFCLFVQCVPLESRLEKAGPIALLKALKNDVELEGLRLAHLRDGAAVVKLLSWIGTELDAGSTKRFPCHRHCCCSHVIRVVVVVVVTGRVTEVDVARQSEAYRAEYAEFVSLSFPTIAGSGPNGAIIHYRVCVLVTLM